MFKVIKGFFNGPYLPAMFAFMFALGTIYFSMDAAKISMTKTDLNIWNFAIIIIFAILTIVFIVIAKIATANLKVDLNNKTFEIDEK